jgi:histone chaperone ASF1
MCTQADAPDPARIPAQELLGVTAVLLTCSYMDQEFIRIGYYVNNDYDDVQLYAMHWYARESFSFLFCFSFQRRENPPESVDLSLVYRSILADKPRVTRFNINWDGAMVSVRVDGV